MRASYLHDDRRYLSHAHLFTPGSDAEPVLSPRHDYYIIWGQYRGIDADQAYRPAAAHWGFIDVRKALDDALISAPERDTIIASARDRLARFGLTHKALEDYELLLLFDDEGRLKPGTSGGFDLILCMDALSAHNYGIVEEDTYRHVIQRTKAKLMEAGCEAINLSGNHLLLAMTPDGVLRVDRQGDVEVTLCNCELLSCPAALARGT